MKTIPGFNLRSILLAAFFAGLGFGNHASAQNVYHAYLIGLNSRTATDLGIVDGNFGRASAINDAGQVVGFDDTGKGGGHSFITGPDGMGMRDLGSLPSRNNYSIAHGINESGQVTGYSGAAGSFHAFITGPDGMGIRDLGTLGGSVSWALGINDAGQVVGWSFTAGGATHAFITDPNGKGMRDLGTLGGDDSEASAINDAGQVVGWSETAAGATHAFITGPDGTGMRDLGTLGGSSWASGINDAGQVVGRSDTPEGVRHAFITEPDGVGMTDLNSLVDFPSGVTLIEGNDINNADQVIAFVHIHIPVVPEPESYALLLAGLALVAAVVRRKKDADVLPAPY